MNNYHNILDKLEAFTKKYYTKMLLKGVLLFLVLGMIFFFVVLGVEYLLWLKSTGRLILLLAFIGVEAFLLFRYILTPLFYLFKIKKGISNKQASLLIGKHFTDVNDKLYNLLELADNREESELLLASIDQRARQMKPVPFVKAVDYKDNLRYIKYLALPVLLFGLIWLSGNVSEFFGSSKRIVNYDMAYEPPAPFDFKLISTDLTVLNDKSHTIQVGVEGKIRPSAVYIVVAGKRMLLQEENNQYQYTFTLPIESTEFYFEANEVQSRTYRLNVLNTPAIQNFEMKLDYPTHTNRKSDILKSTGNAEFPEGTKVSWKIKGQDTDLIQLITADTAKSFNKAENSFQLNQRVYSNLSYEIATSNANVKDYERLGYEFKVIRDAYPSIKVNQIIDSLNPNTLYYNGEATDDYRLKKIRLICYADDDKEKKQELDLITPNSNFEQFYYTFPSGLSLEPGKNYSYYFEAIDNDAIHGGKSSKSQIFSMALLDADQLTNKDLESQQSIINSLDKSLEKFKEQKESLNEINQTQKEKQQLNFNDQNQIKDFLKKQQQQESMMQKFSKQLKDNLNKNKNDDKLNELLKERLERQELQAKKNEKLLEELNKMAEKINKEDLAKRLEDLAKSQQNSERNLEQLLELTKRYYVTEKASQLAKELEKLAKRQDILSELRIGEEFSSKEQEKLNEDFEKLAEELEELRKDNQDLKKPLDINVDKKKEQAVKENQQDALEEINKHQGEEESSQEAKKEESASKAKKKQKSAAQKMQEMSEQLQESSAGGGGGSTITEDAEILRQILDNLVTFSFKQEHLFELLEASDLETPHFSGSIKKQQELLELFTHIDDSLFALSLRRAELSEFVNEQITEVYYNTDKALESIAESQIYQGVSYQKYVLNAANSLSDFLANILDSMQESMQSGKGEGEGEGFQLPDIIKAQGELKEKMEGKGKGKESKGQEGEGNEGQKGQQSGDGNQGNEGQEGNKGEDVKEGEGGKEGEGKAGENGSNGKGGEQQEGQGGEGSQGNQNGPSEEELQEIYEIYKEQQMLRERLEKQLQDMINSSDRKLGQKLVKQMEDFENDLLENGITQQSLNKINRIQHELLKLENATLKQGKKEERESNTDKKQYNNPILTKPSQLENYRNEVEILNRQALPLRQNFKNRVKEYFKSDG